MLLPTYCNTMSAKSTYCCSSHMRQWVAYADDHPADLCIDQSVHCCIISMAVPTLQVEVCCCTLGPALDCLHCLNLS
jgi:hypothetical protein